MIGKEKAELVVRTTAGLNAFAVTRLVSTAMQYDADISLRIGRKVVSVTSFMGVMSLAIASTADLTFSAEGRDASAALQAIEGVLR